jgi:hypothetical protein
MRLAFFVVILNKAQKTSRTRLIGAARRIISLKLNVVLPALTVW